MVPTSTDRQQSSTAPVDRQACLSALNASMNAMLDALDHGLFLFGPDGICSPVATKACVSLLGVHPAGLPVASVLRLTETETRSVDRVLNLVFSDISFAAHPEELLALLPESVSPNEGEKITLSYHPIFDDSAKLTSILAVAEDRSEEEKTKTLLHQREVDAMRVLRISGNRNLFIQFYRSITSFFSTIDSVTAEETPLDVIRRDIHTFKGNASLFHLQDLVDILHALESTIAEATTVDEASPHIEAVLPKLKAVFKQTHKQAYDILGTDFDQNGITRTIPLRTLGKIAEHLKDNPEHEALYQNFVETLMCEPVRKALLTFDVGLHELADRFGKKIAPCYYMGDNFLLLTETYQDLFAAFSHIARNIITHAIEAPETRVAQNKDPEITVLIETKKYTRNDQNWFQISFEDDGAGIDLDKLRKKLAAQKGKERTDTLSDLEVMNSIFHDGISTTDTVDELSGRGVGLSAVRQAVDKFGGAVSVESEKGVFTKIIIDAPLILGTFKFDPA